MPGFDDYEYTVCLYLCYNLQTNFINKGVNKLEILQKE